MADDTTGVSITFKAGTGYDAPWIVIHGRDVAHAREMALELAGTDLLEGVSKLARTFHGNYAGVNPAGRAGTQATSAPTVVAQGNPGTFATPSGSPPPPFVDNQQAQPAGWGQPSAQQLLQQNLGATVVSQVPNEVAYCQLHNAPRTFHPAGVGRQTGKAYGESYRCQIQGCKPVWKNQNGSWS